MRIEKTSKQKVTLGHFLRNRILWKVYFMWFLRRIVPLIVLQIAVFALAIEIFAGNVFVSHVFQNAAVISEGSYWSVLEFMFNSFLNTRPLTQIATLVILGIIALLIRDLIRMAVTYHSMWVRTGSDEEPKNQ